MLKILINYKASPTDAKKAEESLVSYIEALNISKSVEAQQTMVEMLDKHIEKIKESCITG